MTIAMLASLVIMATPASASTLAWGEETTTKNLKSTTLSTSLAPAGTDLVDLAVNGSTIYAAATAATGNITYKSTDGGTTWSSLYFTTSYPTTKIPQRVAVASDDVNTVVLLTTDSTVYYSSNGGSSWTNLGIPTGAATINAIAVSSGTTKTIVAGGRTTGGVAELYTLSLSLASSWTARYDTTGTAPAGGARTSQTDIFAVEFSPSYSTDNIITAISGSTTDNITYLQAFRNTANARGWNGNITWYTGWGTGIALETLPGGIAAADIALHPAYRGPDETTRIAFTATAGTTSGGKVNRVTDVTAAELKTWASITLSDVGSIALHSSGKLLAGDYDDNQVFYFSDAMASAPKAASIITLKQPSGADKTVVAWVGDTAVAATSGAESSFSVSTDSGKTFNDVSLIDTVITTMFDVALNAAGTKLYLTTEDASDEASIWVKNPTWQRILSRAGSTTTKLLVRIAPDNDAVAYVADQGTQDMWVTKNSGMTWSYIPIYNLSLIQDFVVQSADVVYAIDTAGLTKTTDAGGSWGSKKTPTDTFTAYSVTLATNSANTSDVLIGGSGYVAYSKDGGATVTRTQATTAGNVQVVADKDYATNNVIYVGVATTVQRGKADATSSFLTRSATSMIDSTQNVVGLVRDGVIIYALSSNSTDSALHRALNLTSAVASGTDALWSSATSTSEFEATPSALHLTTGGVLWAIDTANTLSSFTDGLSTGAVTLNTPATAYEIPINVTTGLAYDTTFTGTRQNTSVTGTVLEIATDAAFTSIIYTNTNSSVTTDIVSRVIGPSGSTDDTGAKASFMPGTTYYWRVRASLPLRSVWSEVRTLKVGKTAPAVAPILFDIVSPIRGAANVPINAILTWTPYEGAIGYEVALATDPTFAIIDYSHNVAVSNLFYASETLNYSTTYYWRVRGVTGPAPAKKAAPGGAWATGAFTTMAEPAKAVAATPAAPQIIIQKEPAPPAEIKVVEVPVSTPAPIPSYLLWIIIVIGAVLIIALITLIARTRRVS